MTAFDLEGYLARIGRGGARGATLATLAAVHAGHAEAIAFENLDPLLGIAPRLDLEAVQAKLVRGGRGGWCFEHNLLLARALEALGFAVTGLAARVVWNQPEGAATARSHMLLKVDLDGEPWIADAGFGGQTLTAPLRLVTGPAQDTPHGPFRLAEAGGHWVLESLVAREWKALYRFDLVPALPPDYEVANWYLANHPSSHFVRTLVAARVAPGRRYALRGNEFAVHSTGAPSVRRRLASAAEIRAVLSEAFGIALPGDARLDSVLERIARAP